MNPNLKIAIADSSVIIRCGLENLLKHLPGCHFQIVDICSEEILLEALRMHHPDVLIINPQLPGFSNEIPRLKEESGCQSTHCVAFLHALVPDSALQHYDDQMNLFYSAEDIKEKLERFSQGAQQQEPEDDALADEQQTLSSREKEVVKCVVKGMTNREIAEHLFISPHTVITHRRNISRKLQIHTTSGLTIYAVVNKLVELGDIKQ